MNRDDAFTAWKAILGGRKPLLSIELTKECPLRCPGCYAYDEQHLGGERALRDLSDEKGDALVERVLQVVDQLRPLHLSIVGGDPLVRYRELSVLLPKLLERGIYVQLVTSAFRELPNEWAAYDRFKLVVSVDGLQEEHDSRRSPATYARILRNITGQRITVHCTLVGQMLKRPGYVGDFLNFWSARDEVRQIWFSLFTPQRGSTAPEILTPAQRATVVEELLHLRPMYPKLDMSDDVVRQFSTPPESPRECVFAKTTETVSADLKTRISPCQFGGEPDCANCGCLAAMGLNALANKNLAPGLKIRAVFNGSIALGNAVRRLRGTWPFPVTP
jgi:MoaA/NifB/PqqE/SkfB family radical SAM enzyme